MKGEMVKVFRPSETGVDDLNNPVYEYEEEAVDNVLVCPKATNNEVDGIRQEGISLGLTLHFPKTFSKSLEGCHVECRGKRFSVLGNPQPYTLENCPTQWWLPVEVEAFDG